MTYTWFKLHHDIIDDIKLRRFTHQEKWAWITLLCLASKSEQRGIVDADDEDIADYCGFNSTQDWLYYRDKLIAKGMLEISPTGALHVLHWEKRQHQKPSATPEAVKERVRKHRLKKKQQQQECNGNTPVTPEKRLCNATDTDTDTDTDPHQDPDPEGSADCVGEEKEEVSPAPRKSPSRSAQPLHPAARMEARLTGEALDSPEWVASRQGFNYRYKPEMLKAVVNYLSGLPRWLQSGQRATQGDAVRWLNAANFDTADGCKRRLDAQSLWEEVQAKDAPPALPPRRPVPLDTPQDALQIWRVVRQQLDAEDARRAAGHGR